MARFYSVLLITLLSTLSLSSESVTAQWIEVDAAGNGMRCITVNGSLVFAGTFGSGVLRSIDSGKSWVPVSGNQIGFVNAFVTAPPGIYAAANNGIFLTTDSGDHWAQVGKGAAANEVVSLAYDGTALYAGTRYDFAVRSANMGSTWTGMNVGSPGVIALATNGTNIYASEESGISRSLDHGNTWTAIWPADGSSLHVNTLAASGTNIFANYKDSGIVRSTNSGDSWTTVNPGLVNERVTSITISGTNVFAATMGGGVYLSTNAGNRWSAVNDGLTDSVVFLIASGNGFLYAAVDSLSAVWRRPLSEMTTEGVSSVAHFSGVYIANFPNPFSCATTIAFESSGGPACLTIVNLLGQEIAQLHDGMLTPGHQSFKWDCSNAPPGIYECVVHELGNTRSRRMLLSR